ncbi:MAG: DUF4190 domain-containing protein [Oscillospiraceae bacterium]
MENKTNVKSIVALVCGLLGVVGSFFTAHPAIPLISLALAIIGIVFGALGMKESKATGSGHGLAVAGLVLGIIGTVFSLVGVICAFACSAANEALEDSGLSDTLKELEDLASSLAE